MCRELTVERKMTILTIKENLYTFIVKNGKVDSTRLVRWCRENGIGILLLSLALQELEKERKVRALEKRPIGKISIDNKEIMIELPTAVEAVQLHREHREHRSSTSVRRSSRRSTILDSILGVSSVEKEKKKKEEKKEQKVESRDLANVQKVDNKIAEIEELTKNRKEEQVTADHDNRPESSESIVKESKKESEIETQLKNCELNDIMREVRNTMKVEVESNPHREEILNTILAYLSKYWSVGELRLRIDVSKMLSPKLGLKEDELFETVGKILKILRRYNIIEIVEPGVVNLLRRDIRVSFGRTRLLEVLGS